MDSKVIDNWQKKERSISLRRFMALDLPTSRVDSLRRMTDYRSVQVVEAEGFALNVNVARCEAGFLYSLAHISKDGAWSDAPYYEPQHASKKKVNVLRVALRNAIYMGKFAKWCPQITAALEGLDKYDSVQYQLNI